MAGLDPQETFIDIALELGGTRLHVGGDVPRSEFRRIFDQRKPDLEKLNDLPVAQVLDTYALIRRPFRQAVRDDRLQRLADRPVGKPKLLCGT